MNKGLNEGLKFVSIWVVIAFIVWGIHTVFPLHPAYTLGIGYISGITAGMIIIR